MSVTIQNIKDLRERTQAGMSDCKKALTEASGDMDKAVEIILKKGQAKSAKRAGKIAAEGEVRTALSADSRSAVIAEVNIETDFSARNANFTAFVDKAIASAWDVADGGDFAAATFEGKTLTDHANDLTAIIGEKITLRRTKILAIAEGKKGLCHSYVHMGGKIGVILAIETSNEAVAQHAAVKSFADDTAMQIAAMNPMALGRDAIDPKKVAKQREIFSEQLRNEAKPKPEAVWPKIVEGKVNKWFGEVTLLEQESAQHKKQTIKGLLEAAAKEAGGTANLVGFVRYELGDGIQKKSESLEEGVAELLKN